MPSTMEKANSMLLFIDNTWELRVKQDYPLVWETMKTDISRFYSFTQAWRSLWGYKWVMLWHALAVFCLALHCSFLTCFYFPRMPARPVQQIPCPILTKHTCVCIKHAHVCSSHDLLTGSSNETMCPLRGQMIALSCRPRPSSSLPANNTHVRRSLPNT